MVNRVLLPLLLLLLLLDEPGTQAFTLKCASGIRAAAATAAAATAAAATAAAAPAAAARRSRQQDGFLLNSATAAEERLHAPSAAPSSSNSSSRSSSSRRARHLVVIDWSDRLVPYEDAWLAQHALLQHQLLQLDQQQQQQQAEVTQHPSVYTLGQNSQLHFVGDATLQHKERHLLLPQQLQQQLQRPQGVRLALTQIGDRIPRAASPISSSNSSISRSELLRVERGGEVTWHGPGQLVFYPIFDLRRHRTDVRLFVEALESTAAEALVSLWTQTLQQHQVQQHQVQQQEEKAALMEEALCSPELLLTRIKSMPGVWAAGKKICAVGIRLRRWVSFHGLCLNVSNSLCPYSRIVACGLCGKEPTNALLWMQLLKRQQNQQQQEVEVGAELLLRRAADALMRAAADVFGFSSVFVTQSLSQAVDLSAAGAKQAP
ncbi:hypothetical protein Esti_004485 [Eimeria stiedai]